MKRTPARIDGVAKSNIDCMESALPPERRGISHDTVVLVFFLDPCALDRFAIEENAVVIFDLADARIVSSTSWIADDPHPSMSKSFVAGVFRLPERKQCSAFDCELLR